MANTPPTTQSSSTAPTAGAIALIRAAQSALTHLCLVGVQGDLLSRLAPFLSGLTSLEVLHSPGFDTTACRALGRGGRLRSLRQLRVLASPLDDMGLQVLADGGVLDEVRDVDLQSLCGITDEGLKRVARVVRKMRWLRVIDCPHVTDDAVLALLRASPHTETLHLAGPRLTPNLYWTAPPMLHWCAWIVLDGAALAAADWADLRATRPDVARAVHHGWLLAAHGLATSGVAATAPGAPSTGTTASTVSGSPFGPVLMTPAAVQAAARAAERAVGSRVRTAGVPIGVDSHKTLGDNCGDGGDDSDIHSEDPSHNDNSGAATDSGNEGIDRVRRKELFRPAVDAAMVMVANPPNPYVMQDLPKVDPLLVAG